MKVTTKKQSTEEVINQLNSAELAAQRRVCELASSIIFNGGLSKPAAKEKELIRLLIKLGFLYPNFSNEVLNGK